MGSYSGTCSSSYNETFRKNALWSYNSARAHDGLPPLTRLPAGTSYHRVARKPATKALLVIQGHFAYGWEDVSEYEQSERGQAMKDLREYLASRTGAYRLITRRVPNQ